jgi:hypothetical protein
LFINKDLDPKEEEEEEKKGHLLGVLVNKLLINEKRPPILIYSQNIL